MLELNHYQTLGISEKADQKTIKSAYRSLVKEFHPDSHSDTANHEKIIAINGAYEVLGDPQRRRCYDRQLLNHNTRRQQKAAQAQREYQRYRANEREADLYLSHWLKQVYSPINRWLSLILHPLAQQIDELAADPFDDDLMGDFQQYLSDCRHYLENARYCFEYQPNPPKLAGIAAHLYYCLNQISDGIEELELFTLNYDEYYLHTGQELFRIAQELRQEAQNAAKHLIAI
jgi:molecular chaperone DnaJ